MMIQDLDFRWLRYDEAVMYSCEGRIGGCPYRPAVMMYRMGRPALLCRVHFEASMAMIL